MTAEANWIRKGGGIAQWATNEKVAFEIAYTGSLTGLRAAVSMKQVGLNVASDPLMSAAYTGVSGGFLVVSDADLLQEPATWKVLKRALIFEEPPLAASFPASRVLTAVLTHPLALALKRPARNVRWRIRGRGIANPPLPHRVSSVLFVCLGNICRSPFGALLATALEAETGGKITGIPALHSPSHKGQSPVLPDPHYMDHSQRKPVWWAIC